jgi:hypothetical protein
MFVRREVGNFILSMFLKEPHSTNSNRLIASINEHNQEEKKENRSDNKGKIEMKLCFSCHLSKFRR